MSFSDWPEYIDVKGKRMPSLVLPPLSIPDALLDEAFDVVAEAFTATAS